LDSKNNNTASAKSGIHRILLKISKTSSPKKQKKSLDNFKFENKKHPKNTNKIFIKYKLNFSTRKKR